VRRRRRLRVPPAQRRRIRFAELLGGGAVVVQASANNHAGDAGPDGDLSRPEGSRPSESKGRQAGVGSHRRRDRRSVAGCHQRAKTWTSRPVLPPGRLASDLGRPRAGVGDILGRDVPTSPVHNRILRGPERNRWPSPIRRRRRRQGGRAHRHARGWGAFGRAGGRGRTVMSAWGPRHLGSRMGRCKPTRTQGALVVESPLGTAECGRPGDGLSRIGPAARAAEVCTTRRAILALRVRATGTRARARQPLTRHGATGVRFDLLEAHPAAGAPGAHQNLCLTCSKSAALLVVVLRFRRAANSSGRS